MARVYIAGPLCEEKNRVFLEEIDKICRDFGFDTFLPHRDAGLFSEIKDIKKISKKDLEELHNCDFLIGVLNGICVGAGTSWEMGYMAALKKPVIGLKTDQKITNSIGDISVIIAGEVNIIESIEELKKELEKLREKF